MTQLDIFSPGDETGSASDVRSFAFPETGDVFEVVVIDGAVWLVAPPIARALSYRDAPDMVRNLDPDEKGTHIVRTPGGEQKVYIISEPGLWRVITMRRKGYVKDARMQKRIADFQRWVFHEVIPAAVRGEQVPAFNPDAMPRSELARRWYEAELLLEQRDAVLAIAGPKADAWDVLASAEGDMSVREAAFVLNRDSQISTGQNRLFNTLKDLGWIDKRKVPYAAHEKHVRLRVYSYEDHETGESHTRQQVRITAEGLRLLHKRLGGASPLSHLMPVDPPAA